MKTKISKRKYDRENWTSIPVKIETKNKLANALMDEIIIEKRKISYDFLIVKLLEKNAK